MFPWVHSPSFKDHLNCGCQRDDFAARVRLAMPGDLKTHYDTLEYMKDLTFTVNPNIKKAKSIKEVIDYIN